MNSVDISDVKRTLRNAWREHKGKIFPALLAGTLTVNTVSNSIDGVDPVSMHFKTYVNGQQFDDVFESFEGHQEWLRTILEEEVLSIAKTSDLANIPLGWKGGVAATDKASLNSTNFLWAEQWLRPLLAVSTEIGEDAAKVLNKLSLEEVQKLVDTVYDRATDELGAKLLEQTGKEPHFTQSAKEALLYRAEYNN